MSELNGAHELITSPDTIVAQIVRPTVWDGYTYQSASGCEVTLRFATESSDDLVDQVLDLMVRSGISIEV